MNANLTRRDHFALEMYKLVVERYFDKERVPMCELADFAIKAADLLTERLDHYPEGIFSDNTNNDDSTP